MPKGGKYSRFLKIRPSPPLLRLFLLRGGVVPNGHSKYHTLPPPPPLFFLSFFFFSCPWQRSFNPRQTVRYIYFFPSAENSYKNSAFRKRRFPHPPYISYFFRVMNRHQSSSCSGDTLLRLFESRLGNKFQDDFFIAINSTGRKRICKNEE